MINNHNNQSKNPSTDIRENINKLISDTPEMGNDIKNLINSLSEDDIKKIAGIMKNKDIQSLASQIMESKKR